MPRAGTIYCPLSPLASLALDVAVDSLEFAWEDDLDSLRRLADHTDTDIPSSELRYLNMARHMPPLVRENLTPRIVRGLHMCLGMASWKLYQAWKLRPSCLAEELCMYSIISVAQADLTDTHDLFPATQDEQLAAATELDALYQFAFDDDDYLEMYHASHDGIADSPVGSILGMAPQTIDALFEPFLHPEERGTIHPFLARDKHTWPPITDHPDFDYDPERRGGVRPLRQNACCHRGRHVPGVRRGWSRPQPSFSVMCARKGQEPDELRDRIRDNLRITARVGDGCFRKGSVMPVRKPRRDLEDRKRRDPRIPRLVPTATPADRASATRGGALDAFLVSGTSPPADPAASTAEGTRTRTATCGPRMVTADALAERLGVHVETVYRRTREGTIPHYRVGPILRFDVQEVLDSLHQPAASREDPQTSERR